MKKLINWISDQMKNKETCSKAAGDLCSDDVRQCRKDIEPAISEATSRDSSSPDKSGGLILLNKPPGITSFKGLNVLKKELGTGKVGHTGTLDKFADGLIVALYGKMTKLVPEFTGMDKEYIAEIQFGKETDTLDPEGVVVATAEPPLLSTIESEIPHFTGIIKQTPPQYSAIHINGKRAYELVRSGKEVVMPTREIEIYMFEVLSFSNSLLIARIRCSKGTYIRSLARDLAIKCGSRAHLTALKRIEVGPFSLNDALSPETFDARLHTYDPWEIFDYLPLVDKVQIDDSYISDIKMGREGVLGIIGKNFQSQREYALFDSTRNMVALVVKKDERISYRFVC